MRASSWKTDSKPEYRYRELPHVVAFGSGGRVFRQDAKSSPPYELPSSATDWRQAGGTSWSAPAAASAVARLMSIPPSDLKGKPEACRAILIATAVNIDDRIDYHSFTYRHATTRTGFDPGKVWDGVDGGGLIDLVNARRVLQNKVTVPTDVRTKDKGTGTAEGWFQAKFTQLQYSDPIFYFKFPSNHANWTTGKHLRIVFTWQPFACHGFSDLDKAPYCADDLSMVLTKEGRGHSHTEAFAHSNATSQSSNEPGNVEVIDFFPYEDLDNDFNWDKAKVDSELANANFLVRVKFENWLTRRPPPINEFQYAVAWCWVEDYINDTPSPDCPEMRAVLGGHIPPFNP